MMQHVWRLGIWVSVAAATVACGKDSAKPAGSTAAAGSAATAPAPAPVDAAGPAPLDPKIKAARCDEPCLFLAEVPYDKLVDAYKAECGKDTKQPGLDECEQLDYMRNCIFAAHGFAFEKKKWKKAFAKRSWYAVDPAFKASMVSATERATVTTLNDAGKACKAGQHISAKDLARVKAFFAALPKVPGDLPKTLMVEHEVEKPKLFVKDLMAYIDPTGTTKSVDFDKVATTSYDKGADGELAVLQKLALTKDPKIRTVAVDINDADTVGDEEHPVLAGTYVWFVFDDKDTLLAIDVSQYVYD